MEMKAKIKQFIAEQAQARPITAASLLMAAGFVIGAALL